MLQAIMIEKLFGRFDYNIELKEEGVTILTGPNGFGKSTILKIIEAVANNNFLFLFELDFEAITLNFTNNKQEVRFSKTEKYLQINDKEIDLKAFYIQANRIIINNIPWIEKFPDGFFYDRRADRKYHITEILKKYIFTEDENITRQFENFDSLKIVLDAISELKKELYDVRFISEQRLLKKRESNGLRRLETEIIDVIEQLPEELQDEIGKVSGKYSNVANFLDSTYPQRLFDAKVGMKDSAEFKDKLDAVREKFEKLDEYDLGRLPAINDVKYDSKYSTALKIYFDDFDRKYKVFEPLINKLELFANIINSRFMFKRVKLSKNGGMRVLDIDNPKKIIPLKQLSSGEKQEMILFYDLIFKTNNNLLLLIDEPEISLHIVWQKRFIEDMLKVIKNTGIRVIVATHSPQIIGNRWDLQVDLAGLYRNG